MSIQPQNDLSTLAASFPFTFHVRRSIAALPTPIQANQVKLALNIIKDRCNITTRDAHHLARKITKGFNKKDYLLVQKDEKIKQLEARITALQPKVRKKVKLSPNAKFGNIKAIRKAQIDTGMINDSLTEESGASETNSEGATVVEDCIVVGVKRGRRTARRGGGLARV